MGDNSWKGDNMFYIANKVQSYVCIHVNHIYVYLMYVGKYTYTMATMSVIYLPLSCTQYGWTPLMRASFNGHVDIVRILIEAKAQINTQDKV